MGTLCNSGGYASIAKALKNAVCSLPELTFSLKVINFKDFKMRLPTWCADRFLDAAAMVQAIRPESLPIAGAEAMVEIARYNHW